MPHSVTCHPAAVTFPPSPQLKLVLDLATWRNARLSWLWAVDGVALLAHSTIHFLDYKALLVSSRTCVNSAVEVSDLRLFTFFCPSAVLDIQRTVSVTEEMFFCVVLQCGFFKRHKPGDDSGLYKAKMEKQKDYIDYDWYCVGISRPHQQSVVCDWCCVCFRLVNL